MSRWLSDVQAVARAEWCAWRRSRLSFVAAALVVVLLLTTALLTSLRMQAERARRVQQQNQAETSFTAQPNRHPHRMVHFGHYAFRTPAPLALFDPGLDAVTGQAIFLEGHRHNTAMFADASASAHLGALSWLSPATVYLLFGPLLLVLLAHGALAREREAGALATLLALGLPGRRLLAGKALALAYCVLLLLVPLALSAALAVAQGEAWSLALTLLGAYLLYLCNWAGLALLASALLKSRSAALTWLVTLWLALTLVLPAVAVSWATHTAPMQGKLETDLAMLADVRKLGDGHNANDPAFKQLRLSLLKQHGVQRVEDLPVNLRGAVAEYSERKLTEKLNAYTQRQMAAQTRQANKLSQQGWFLPSLALADASRALAGTDLQHYHRFLKEAEALRYAFVQGLNKVHAEQLAYADDVKRSSDPQAEQRTRVAASNWQLLQQFRFQPAPASDRVAQARPHLLMLLLWCGLLAAALVWAGARLKP